MKSLVAGIQTSYLLEGQGIPLLLLHGWGGSAAAWQRVMDLLVADGFRVLAPDLPGFGASGEPPQVWGVPEYADWARELGQSVLGPRFSLLGHSFGGRIGIYLAAHEAGIIDSLVLCSAAGIKPRDLKTRIRKWLGRSVARLTGSGANHSTTGNISLVRRVMYRLLGAHDYAAAAGIMKQVMSKVVEQDLTPLLSLIHSPTLILWGEQDKMTPLKDGQLMHKLIRSSKLKTFPDVHHGVHKQVPDQVAQAVSAFFHQRSA